MSTLIRMRGFELSNESKGIGEGFSSTFYPVRPTFQNGVREQDFQSSSLREVEMDELERLSKEATESLVRYVELDKEYKEKWPKADLSEWVLNLEELEEIEKLGEEVEKAREEWHRKEREYLEKKNR